MQKLPIGTQDFRILRENDFLYVDKTRQIHQLITDGRFYFFSRPRRFGKSLTVSTLKEIFTGSKELFKGLWIENKWDWSQRNPVVHLGFSSIGYQDLGLEQALLSAIDDQAAQNGVKLEQVGISLRFKELLSKLAREKRVVLLIDEYDKPIIDYLEREKRQQASENRQILKRLYSIIKDSDPYLQLVFITGVSKFSKISVFSDLNNLEDITIDRRFGDLVGYTQAELETFFAPYLPPAASNLDLTIPELLDRIKEWYNGYSWQPGVSVYNPFSILNFFQKRTFGIFWFETGTPTFLINILKERQLFDLEDVQVDQLLFESYTLENLETYSLLFQTGYLTLKSADEFGLFTLSYPNREVKESMLRHLISAYRHETEMVTPVIIQLRKAFLEGQIDQVIEIIKSLFKNIPSTLFIKNKESYYHSLIFLLFHYLGIFIEAEVHTADGRLDAVVQTPATVYILEFKLDKSAQEALSQIKTKGYAEKYLHTPKKIIGLGINFESKKKTVGEWVSEELG
jgi:hypothetical protein